MSPIATILLCLLAVSAVDAALVALLWWRTLDQPLDFRTTSDWEPDLPAVGGER